ncbi:MAG: nitronate monooxygenase [Gemmatimonadota bacterium]|jgi:NAD(P)H-dependent flavin oxidoreductase YrpB (nitropropane dioxygenase family)|nr:nitronate monooxygenase [Gemmatimonadota bacterium]
MSATFAHPMIIQGGMGVGVSDWVLAKAVSMRGQLGVVSGTALDSVFVRRLQDGDIGGHVRRALDHFPIPEVSADIMKRYFLPEGRPDGMPYKPLPMYKQVMGKVRQQLTLAANFVEVYLAKEGHDGPVGINLLTKVQMPNLDSLYGAMLAGVDYVLMGAGIPKEIPGALDRFARGEPASIKLDVEGLARGEAEYLHFDPALHWGGDAPELKRPFFLPIIASNSLATMLARKANGRVDGFIIEGPTAGGHNAPPRGEIQLNERGEPVYGERDVVDLGKVGELGLPFWVAGGTGAPEKLLEVLEAGGTGVQVGTLFAYSEESGLRPEHKQRVVGLAHSGEALDVLTDFRASPTGFPFKVVQLGGSISEERVYERRERVCDLGYLRTAYKSENGRVGYRCPAEPVDTYVKKGGDVGETVGRKCLCNALMADIGYGQLRDDGEVEKPLLTSGDDLKSIRRFLGDRVRYTAGDVIDYLLGSAPAAVARESALEAFSTR